MILLMIAFPKPPLPTVVANKIASQLARTLTTAVPSIIKHLPEPPFILQKTIGEKILQQLMAEQIEMGDFDFLEAKWLQINVEDMGLSFFLSFADHKLVMAHQVAQADVCFSGTSKEFILLAARTEDPDTLFFQRRLVIEGDTELGLYIKNSIDGIDFDNWPQWLNSLVNKIAALVKKAEKLDRGADKNEPTLDLDTVSQS